VRKQRRLSLMAFAVLSCSGPATTEDMQPAAKPGPSGAACPSGSELTYASFASDFFGSYCVRCHDSQLAGLARHGAPSAFNYDTLEGVMAVSAEAIDSMAAAGPSHLNTFMPPADPRPSRGEREKLAEWLACDRP
jgi:cytochrome c5